jgi:hypothetical protein
MLCDVGLKAVNVCFAAAYESAIQLASYWSNYLPLVDSNQWFQGDIKDKGAMFAYSIPKRHHTGIADI